MLYKDAPSGTVQRARDLRRNAPGPERHLLRALRDTYPHLKWRHQAPLGPFYADMLCFSEKLVIEVDGDTHAGAEGSDTSRAGFMAREGYRTIRVSNTDVMTNLEGVIEHISFSLREKEGAAQPRKDEGLSPKKKGGTA
ncbi:endonuclease domain-containing protein [Sphingomonas sp. DC2300-3]|uniref:endonuclease domain-containing protein n=1 Tax=unclassified Sphingomonas TaxID=196159 RepID=UPI003CF54036